MRIIFFVLVMIFCVMVTEVRSQASGSAPERKETSAPPEAVVAPAGSEPVSEEAVEETPAEEDADAEADKALGVLPKKEKKSAIQKEARQAATQQTADKELEEINRQQAERERQTREAEISERQKTIT